MRADRPRNGKDLGIGSGVERPRVRRRPRVRALVCALALALLAAAPSAALRLVLGVEELTFRWARASGPVESYVVMVVRNGGPPHFEQIVVDPRVTLPVASGESVAVKVRALGREPDGSLTVGPLSPISEEIHVQATPNFAHNGLWTLHCAPCAEIGVQPFSEPAPVAQIAAPGPGWRYGGLAWLGRFPQRIWWSPDHGVISLWDASVSPEVTLWEQRPTLAERRLAGALDPDGDGFDELVLYDPDAARVEFWRVEGTGLRVAATLPAPSQSTLALADVVGDARTDLLWHDPGSGAVLGWTLDGFARASAHRIGTQLDADATLADTGDYDGDGRDEILWRTSDGAFSVWYLEAGALRRVAYLPALPGDAYRRVVGSAAFNSVPGEEIAVQDTRNGEVHAILPLVETDPVRLIALQPGEAWRVVDVHN